MAAYPTTVSESEVTTTLITTSFVDICPTGFTTIVTVITTTVCPEATATTGIRAGWYTTVTVCDNCGPVPTTVTLTKPVAYKPTAYAIASTEAVYGSTTTLLSTLVDTEYLTVYPATIPSPAPAYTETPSPSYVTKVVTLAVSPVPVTALPYKAVSETSEVAASGYVEATSGYVEATGGSPAPTGTRSASASGGVPYASYTPLAFEGAASRTGVGMGMAAVVVAVFLAL